MTLEELRRNIFSAFKRAGIETASLDAKVLIQGVTGLDDVEFITNKGQKISEAQIKQVESCVARRIEGEPVSKILGVREFWGMAFEVSENTLDPRPDTETLIEAALKWIDGEGRRDAPIKIIDLGTGTGCIPLALLSELPHATAVAVDVSEKALNIARKNAEKYKMSSRITFVQGDWMSGLQEDDFDLIVSNPPYIPNHDIENLSKEVKNHDPILALAGGNDGLDCYRKIFFQLKNKLNGKNRAFLEIGFGQLPDIVRLVDESNLSLCDSVADIAGIPRVVEISCGDK